MRFDDSKNYTLSSTSSNLNNVTQGDSEIWVEYQFFHQAGTIRRIATQGCRGPPAMCMPHNRLERAQSSTLCLSASSNVHDTLATIRCIGVAERFRSFAQVSMSDITSIAAVGVVILLTLTVYLLSAVLSSDASSVLRPRAVSSQKTRSSPCYAKSVGQCTYSQSMQCFGSSMQ